MNLIADHTYCRVPSREVQKVIFDFADEAGVPLRRDEIFTGWMGWNRFDRDTLERSACVCVVNAENAELDMSGHALHLTIPEFIAGIIEEAGWYKGPFHLPERYEHKRP